MKKFMKYLKSITYDVVQAACFTKGILSFVRLSRDMAIFRLIGVLPGLRLNKPRHVTLRPGLDFTYRLNKGDIYAIHEIWFGELYRFPIPIIPRLIVDLGANIGTTSLWFWAKYGCEKIIAVEPSAGNAAIIRENFRRNGIDGEVIEAAIAGSDGTATFYEVASSTNGRLEPHEGNRLSPPVGLTEKRTVRTISMPTLLAWIDLDAPIDLLKIDIEGGEQELLSGDVSWLASVRALVIEFHASLIHYDRLVETLKHNGFRRIHSVCSDPALGNTLEYFMRDESGSKAHSPIDVSGDHTRPCEVALPA